MTITKQIYIEAIQAEEVIILTIVIIEYTTFKTGPHCATLMRYHGAQASKHPLY